MRCFTSAQPKKWLHWLPWAEWSYNTWYHTSAQFTPFELVYGYPPPHIAAYERGTARVELVEQSLIARDRILSQLKSNLEKARNRMKV